MTAALLIPLFAIVLTAVAVYRIFAFLRKDGRPQPAPVYSNSREATPATSISAETLVPRF
ncbi:hypothetical protein [Arthrobacter castelli]|uniref:hypothetical protein n=1 Tax=Arthrobacter castelli TaxID=271431 RepID=UPI000407D346|nr:hypothetical protein [Arthrobacter castelli]